MQVRSFLTAGTCVQLSQFFREGGDPAWVPGTLQGVGVSIARLLDIYGQCGRSDAATLGRAHARQAGPACRLRGECPACG